MGHRYLNWLVRYPSVNPLARATWSVLRRVMPAGFRDALPILGRYPVAVAGSEPLTFVTRHVDYLANLLYWEGADAYESATMRLFRTLASNSTTILDIGANFGIFCLVAAKLHPKVQIHAIEPVPHVYEQLLEHIRLNSLTNLRTHRLALSDTNGQTILHLPRSSQTTARTASLLAQFNNDDCIEVRTPAQTLDSFVAEHQLAKVDLIKMDVESAEHLVFRGAKETMLSHQPFVICEILTGPQLPEVWEALKPLNFRYFLVGEGTLTEELQPAGGKYHTTSDYLMVPRPRWAKLRASLETQWKINELNGETTLDKVAAN